MSAIVVGHERVLEELRRKDCLRLYHAAGDPACIEAEFRTDSASMRQREALRDAAVCINTIVNNVVGGIVTVDAPGLSAKIRYNGTAYGQPLPVTQLLAMNNSHLTYDIFMMRAYK